MKEYLTSGSSTANSFGKHVHLYLYSIEVEEEPILQPDYYTDSVTNRGESPFPSYEPYEDVATSDSTPMLSAPAEGITPAGPRFHTVAKGDTLYALARRYYSDQRRWKDIFAANRDSIGDANKIRVGQRLMIP